MAKGMIRWQLDTQREGSDGSCDLRAAILEQPEMDGWPVAQVGVQLNHSIPHSDGGWSDRGALLAESPPKWEGPFQSAFPLFGTRSDPTLYVPIWMGIW